MLIYVTVRKIACEIWRNEKHWTQTLQLSLSVGFHRGSWVIGQPKFFLEARILSTSSVLSVQLFKFVIISHKLRTWRCFLLVLLRQTCSLWVLKGHCSKLWVCFIYFNCPENGVWEAVLMEHHSMVERTNVLVKTTYTYLWIISIFIWSLTLLQKD